MTDLKTIISLDIKNAEEFKRKYPEVAPKALSWYTTYLTGILASKTEAFIFKNSRCLAVFSDSKTALNTAIAICDSVNREKFNRMGTLEVAIAVHTGPVQLLDGRILGAGADKVEALLQIIPSGNIYATAGTMELLRNFIPGNILVKEAGVELFPDDFTREKIYKVVVETKNPLLTELSDFLPVPKNLVPQFSGFNGRDEELKSVCNLFLSGKNRVVEITGPRGCGKSRLAMQAGFELSSQFLDGLYYLNVSQLESENVLLYRIAEEVGMVYKQTFFELPFIERLTGTIGMRQLILILDNADNSDVVVEVVNKFLRECPELRVILTARNSLHVENCVELPLLDLDYPVAALKVKDKEYASVKCLAASLAYHGNNLSGKDVLITLTEVCRVLKGKQALLEIIAANYSPELAVFVSSLKGTEDENEKNLLNYLFDNLLSVEERKMLVRLSVFDVSFGSEGAFAVCNSQGDINDNLAVMFHSLCLRGYLSRSADGKKQPRYVIKDGFRIIAQARLEGQEEIRDLEKLYFDYLYNNCTAKLNVFAKIGRETDVSLLENERNNIRAALDKCLKEKDYESYLKLCGSLTGYWAIKNNCLEGREWLEKAYGMPGFDTDYERRIRMLLTYGRFCMITQNEKTSEAVLFEALLLAEGRKDNSNIAAATMLVGWHYYIIKRIEEREIWFGRARKLFEEKGDLIGQIECLLEKSFEYYMGGKEDEEYAGRLFSYIDRLKERKLLDSRVGARYLVVVINWLSANRKYKETLAMAEEFEKYYEDIGAFTVAGNIKRAVGNLLTFRAEFPAAEENYMQALQLYQEAQDQEGLGSCFDHLSVVAHSVGHFRESYIFRVRALDIFYRTQDYYYFIATLINLSKNYKELGRMHEAVFFVAAYKNLAVKIDLFPVKVTIDPSFNAYVQELKKSLSDRDFPAYWLKGMSANMKEVIEIVTGRKQLE